MPTAVGSHGPKRKPRRVPNGLTIRIGIVAGSSMTPARRGLMSSTTCRYSAMKKIAAPKITLAIRLASTAPSKRPRRKIVSSTTGLRTLRSIRTNATSRANATRK